MTPPKNNRLGVIDDIRGISIIVMILIHTNAYFLREKLAYSLVEASQFAVVAFIFCSSYLFYQKDTSVSLGSFWGYFKKRVWRLISPYYVFLIPYLGLLFLKTPKILTPSYLIKNLIFTGGIDFNWLVLLFIEFIILMPVFGYLKKNNKALLYIYLFITVISSLVFLKFTPLPYYRWIMWLPWSLIVIYTMYFDELWKDKKMFWFVTAGLFLLFYASRGTLLYTLHRSLRHYENKYPPNLYHLAYSLFCVNILYFLSQMKVFSHIQNIVHFFSKYSYTIYFIHILVIYFLTVVFKAKFDWVGLFVVTIGATSAIQLLLIYVPRYIAHLRSGYLPEPAH